MSDAGAVRSFIALDLDATMRTAVEEATAELRQALGGAVRWAALDTLHVTLRFLGDVTPDAIELLRGALAEHVGPHTPVELRLAGAGSFPPRGRPRVLWVGIETTPELMALHRAVEDACAAALLGRERRPFRPHLTVARPRTGAALAEPALGAALARVGFVAARRVASLHLMRSDLLPAGARHTPIAVLPLVGDARNGRAPELPGAR